MELYRLNKLYIIESLSNELQTGNLLYTALESEQKEGKFSRFNIEYKDISDISDWDNLKNDILNDVVNDRVKPILHLEMHGDSGNCGYVLKNNDILYWKKLFLDFQDINMASGNYLMITLGICRGLNIVQLLKIYDRSPFLIAVGSFFDLLNTDIVYRYSAFYERFLEDYDINESMKALYNANRINEAYKDRYYCLNTVELFKRVYKSYLLVKCSPEGIKKRMEESYPIFLKDKNLLDNRKSKRYFSNHFKSSLKKTKEAEYHKAANKFLMIDKYPENAQRFSIPDHSYQFVSVQIDYNR